MLLNKVRSFAAAFLVVAKLTVFLSLPGLGSEARIDDNWVEENLTDGWMKESNEPWLESNGQEFPDYAKLTAEIFVHAKGGNVRAQVMSSFLLSVVEQGGTEMVRSLEKNLHSEFASMLTTSRVWLKSILQSDDRRAAALAAALLFDREHRNKTYGKHKLLKCLSQVFYCFREAEKISMESCKRIARRTMEAGQCD